MKHALLYAFGLVTAALFAIGAGLAYAQTTANGPYYANPSWDQKLQCDTQATCPRFVVLANWNSEAVLDRETGLVWERTPSIHAPLESAAMGVQTCWNATTGGRQGWRLPRTEELMSLADPANFANSSLPPGHPFLNVYWGTKPLPIGVPNGFGAYGATDAFPGSGNLTFVEFNNLQGSQGQLSPAVAGDSIGAANLGVWCVRGDSGTAFR